MKPGLVTSILSLVVYYFVLRLIGEGFFYYDVLFSILLFGINAFKIQRLENRRYDNINLCAIRPAVAFLFDFFIILICIGIAGIISTISFAIPAKKFFIFLAIIYGVGANIVSPSLGFRIVGIRVISKSWLFLLLANFIYIITFMAGVLLYELRSPAVLRFWNITRH